jgi:ABC-type multidrug transport system ATPase subunit
MLVIASIHQPSTNTLLLFDNVLLLTGGKTVYYGPPANSIRYFISLGHPPPALLSPAEFMLELSNTNFHFNGRSSIDQVTMLCQAWDASLEHKLLLDKLIPTGEEGPESNLKIHRGAGTTRIMKPFILLHRMAIVLPSRPLTHRFPEI